MIEPVYSASEDSWLLEECILKEDLKKKKCLDLGTGSGIQSIAMLKAGALEVVAVDVNESALLAANTLVGKYIKLHYTQNIGHNSNTKNILAKYIGPIFRVFESNLFSSLKKQKFDFVAFNPPYVPSEGIKWRDLDGGKEGAEIILKFVSQIKKHLNKNGVVLLLISSLNNPENIGALLKKKVLQLPQLE